jgi:uncharacterized phage protein (TIGR02218 family)
VRTFGAALAGHIAGTAHKRCTMLRLDLADGNVLAITDHDYPMAFDLGDGEAEYTAHTGILPSDLSLSLGFSADDVEISGPITETGLTTRTAFIGGRFDNARVRLFQVNWSNPAQGAIEGLEGYVVLAEVVGSTFKLTVQSQITKLAKVIGRSITGYCDVPFQSVKCGYSEPDTPATVLSVTDAREFTVSFAGTIASDYFNRGEVEFTSGALLGCLPVRIFDFAGGVGAGAVALYSELAEAPAIGDTLNIRRGCGKTRPACMAYNNIENFRGFPDAPGTDQVLKYPNPS